MYGEDARHPHRILIICIYFDYFICRKRLIVLAQQKIRQMHDLDTVDVACGQFVHRHHIFRVMVFDFKQVCDFPVGFLRQIAATDFGLKPIMQYLREASAR